MFAPCLGCQKRHPLCWNSCEDYSRLVEMNRAVNEFRKQTRINANAQSSALYEPNSNGSKRYAIAKHE